MSMWVSYNNVDLNIELILCLKLISLNYRLLDGDLHVGNILGSSFGNKPP